MHIWKSMLAAFLSKPNTLCTLCWYFYETVKLVRTPPLLQREMFGKIATRYPVHSHHSTVRMVPPLIAVPSPPASIQITTHSIGSAFSWSHIPHQVSHNVNQQNTAKKPEKPTTTIGSRPYCLFLKYVKTLYIILFPISISWQPCEPRKKDWLKATQWALWLRGVLK